MRDLKSQAASGSALLLFLLSGCNGPAEVDAARDGAHFNSAMAEAASNAADAALNSAIAEVDDASSSEAELSSSDLARVCRAAVAHMMGKSPSIMKVKSNSGGVVRIQYRRPDDGTVWKDDCRLEGQRVMWRSVDAVGASGPGRWRNHPDDEVITYSIDGKTIRIGQKWSDGSYDAENYII